jgi:hypothetical protein
MNAEMGFMLQTESHTAQDRERNGEIQRRFYRKAKNTIGVEEYGKEYE